MRLLAARMAVALRLIFCATMAASADSAIDVSLGDVSLNKVAFLVAADNGIYEKNGLTIHQFITKGAAARISRSGIDVPAEFIGTDDQDEKTPIGIGGGSPLNVSMTTDARSTDRFIIATTDSQARFHVISSKALNSRTRKKWP